MRRTPIVLLALALVAVAPTGLARASVPEILVLDQHGHVALRPDRFLPPLAESELPPPDGASTTRPPARADGAGSHASAVARTVPSELRRLQRSGALSADRATAYEATWANARQLVKKLKGTRRAELGAVLTNAEAQASEGLLTASRVPVVLETIRRNAQWWASGPALTYGRRVRFSGSRLVWQAYPGQGVQIQWLGTFGRMNQLFLAKGYDTEVGQMAAEIRSYAVQRAGGIAWEYQFQFGGGRPPWVSGLAQGTAIQAFARAAVRLKDPQWFGVARDALGIFRTPPPSGVRVKDGDGAHYLAYSFAPGQRIFNAFFQAIIGLHDFAALANDAQGRRLWLDGQREAAREVRQADTGSWSLYQPGVASDIGYHKVLRDFVRGLCDRLEHDRQNEVQQLRVRRGPAAVLLRFDRWPDPAPYCLATQSLNRELYSRLRAMGLPTPWG
ncbi:MAG TPA: D-glucuronyl C5-epimerase family protein [Solirubrobacteraceae bacterium]